MAKNRYQKVEIPIVSSENLLFDSNTYWARIIQNLYSKNKQIHHFEFFLVLCSVSLHVS